MIETNIENDSATIDITNIQDGEPNLCENLEFWMTRLPPKLRALPVIHLAIPGSHNSMTYTIEKDNDIGPDEPATIRRMGGLAKGVIFNWSINQEVSIKEQLNGGIRYLDLRVATKSNEIHFLHGLYGAEITQPLREVADWLSAHPNEAIIMDFQHFYDFNEPHHRILIDEIKYIFRGKMCPVYSKLESISLQSLRSEQHQIFVIYRNIIASNYTDLWPSGVWPTPWPNTVSSTKLINFLNDGLSKRVQESGFVSQFLLTPNPTYITKNLCGSLHRNLYPKIKTLVLSWVQQHSPGNGGINIVITDYVHTNDYIFSKTVIQRNASLLELQLYRGEGLRYVKM